MIIDNFLYNKTVKVTFNEFKHQYFIEGRQVPSVTRILSVINKPALINWAANQAIDYCRTQIQPGAILDEIQLHTVFEEARKAHTRRKQSAADIGTMVHQWIEDYINGKNPKMPFNDKLKCAIEQFLKWKEEYNVRFLLSEQVIYSKTHDYVGTLDFVAKVNGRLILGDIKTSAAIWDEYYLQLAAYRIARTEEYPGEKYVGNGIIRIGKDGEFEWREIEEWNHHAEAFVAAKTLYQVLENMKKANEQETF